MTTITAYRSPSGRTYHITSLSFTYESGVSRRIGNFSGKPSGEVLSIASGEKLSRMELFSDSNVLVNIIVRASHPPLPGKQIKILTAMIRSTSNGLKTANISKGIIHSRMPGIHLHLPFTIMIRSTCPTLGMKNTISIASSPGSLGVGNRRRVKR